MPEKKDPTHYSELDPKSMNVSIKMSKQNFSISPCALEFKLNMSCAGERITSRTGGS